MDEINMDLKLSSVRVGSKANPRLVWSLGVEKSFLEGIAPEFHKVKLDQQDGQLTARLTPDGVKIGQSVKGNWGWANNLGVHHITGMKVPEDEMPAQALKGRYDPASKQITFISELPQVVLNSFVDMDAARQDADPETHFPGTHFVEDIRQEQTAENPNMDDPEVALAWFENRVKMGSKTVHTEQAMLTPELAKILIEHNDGNRPVRIGKLNQYVDDILNDRWEFNGETIIVSKEGLINNGQHRTYAVLEANKPIKALFVFGVERDTRKTVDTGATRGPHDQLSADGYPQATTMAAISRALICYEGNEGRGFANYGQVSGQNVYERAKADAEIQESALYPYKFGSKAKRLAPPSVFGTCYYLFKKADPKDAEEFLEQVITGINIPADSAAYITREKLMDLTGLHREQKIELLFRGFLAHRKHKPTKGSQIKVKWELPQL